MARRRIADSQSSGAGPRINPALALEAELHQVRDESARWLRELTRAALQIPPTHGVAAWCEQHLRFDEAGNHGAFTLAGHEYLVEVLEDFARLEVKDEVLVWGSQTRKTGTLMGGVAWCLVHDPCSILWVMPSIVAARRFTRQRFARLLRASAATAALVPRGALRHEFSALEMILGASTLNFVGSNSPANLASTPCRRVILDEVDKFDSGGREEADAVNLAEQRTKDQPAPQRWKTSTPTRPDGLIWREFLKGDQRRYFLPCPHCSREILPVWSPKFSVLSRQGCEAHVTWDPSARRPDGSWDLDRVHASARLICPFCAGDILSSHLPAMIARGVWRPTAKSETPGFVSRHLSSLYSISPETSLGALAVKFLRDKESPEGLHGFINGTLAEPYMGQDLERDAAGYIATRLATAGGEHPRIMTVDCQATSPQFWYVVRVWDAGDSEAIAAGCADSWSEIEAVAKAHGVRDQAVFVDSGFGARSDLEVYQQCAAHGTLIAGGPGQHPMSVGWMPTKGLPGRRRWLHPETRLQVCWHTRPVDPYEGTEYQGRVAIELLTWSVEPFKDLLHLMRQPGGPWKWTVRPEVANEEYQKHLQAEVRSLIIRKNGQGMRWAWVLRDKHWPNHLFDCEVLQLVAANYLGYLSIAGPARQTM